jgi:CheY-like chemotaxis protein
MNQVGWPSGLGIDGGASLSPPVSVHEPSGGKWKKNGSLPAPSLSCRCVERPLSHDWAAVSFASTFSGMPPLHYLVVSADAARRRALAEPLRAGAPVFDTGDPTIAAESLATPGFDVAVIDLHLPSVDLAALRAAIAPADSGPPDSLADAERRHIAMTLRHTDGNRRQAALILGISRSTLLHKIRKYRLE